MDDTALTTNNNKRNIDDTTLTTNNNKGNIDDTALIRNNNNGNMDDTALTTNNKKEHKDNVDALVRNGKDGIPKDHGWAWFVLLGASLEMFLLVGIVKSSGILFIAFQERFGSSSSVTSLLSTVQNICQSVTALLVMTCGIKVMTCRTLLFVGGIITCTAYIITSQAVDIRVLLFSHGVLQGIGAGFMQPTALTMVSLYFEKRRSLANSIAVSGGPVGGLIFAPLITKLLSAYGYQGCVLIIAGILLNGCVSGALFRPALFYTNRQSTLIRKRRPNIHGGEREMQNLLASEDTLNKKIENIAQMTLASAEPDFEHLNENLHCGSTNNIQIHEEEQKQGSDRIMINDDHTKSEPKHLKIPKISQIKNIPDKNIPYSNTASIESNDTHTLRNNHKTFTGSVVKKLEMKGNGDRKYLQGGKAEEISKFCNFRLLQNPIFYALLIQGSLICSGTVVAPIFIAPYARDVGVSAEDAATLVTTHSCIDLFSRIIIGYISDKGWLRRSTIVAISTMVVSVSSSLLRFYTNYTLLLGYTIVLGLVSGVYFALFTVVLIDYLTLANLQTCLGYMALVHGFSVAGAFYLVGYLRDISGSYVIPHHVIGSATGVGTVILFLLPLLQRIEP